MMAGKKVICSICKEKVDCTQNQMFYHLIENHRVKESAEEIHKLDQARTKLRKECNQELEKVNEKYDTLLKITNDKIDIILLRFFK